MKVKLLVALMFGTMLSLPAVAADGPKTVTVVVPEAIDSIDTCDSERNPVGRLVLTNLGEPLTDLDPATTKVIPRLATSWEQNGTTWRFHLRPDVKFQDGTDFTAAAVASSLARITNPATECADIRYFNGIKVTTNVVDDHTIDITTDPFQPILPLALSNVPIVSTSAPADHKDRAPVGTGPYMLDSWPSPQELVLKRFDGYWGKKPEAEVAKFEYRADSAVQAAMVASGEADLAPYIAVQDATNPKTDVPYPNTETPYVMIPTDTKPFDDIRVRKALNLAVDRQSFIGTLVSKDAEVATQMITPFVNGYNPDIKPWPYDPDQAKKLLAEAKADGEPVDTEITLYGNLGLFPNMSDIVSALAQMWRAVGFNVKEAIAERSQFLAMVNQPRPKGEAPGLYINSHDNSTGDAASTLTFKYFSKGGQSMINDAETDKLITEGAAATGEERTKDFQAAFARVNEDIVADVPLFHLVGYARISPRINFKPNTLTNNQLRLEDITFN